MIKNNKIDERRHEKKEGRSREAKLRSKWEEEWRDGRMKTGEVSCAALWMTVTIIQFSVMGAQTGPRANQITANCSGDRTSRSLWPYIYAQSVCNQGNRIFGQQMPCQTLTLTYKSFLTDKWCQKATHCSLGTRWPIENYFCVCVFFWLMCLRPCGRRTCKKRHDMN